MTWRLWGIHPDSVDPSALGSQSAGCGCARSWLPVVRHYQHVGAVIVGMQIPQESACHAAEEEVSEGRS